MSVFFNQEWWVYGVLFVAGLCLYAWAYRQGQQDEARVHQEWLDRQQAAVAKFPELIRVRPGKGMEIDGREFPWYILEDGFAVNAGSRKELTSVTVTIPCDRIEVDDERVQGIAD